MNCRCFNACTTPKVRATFVCLVMLIAWPTHAGLVFNFNTPDAGKAPSAEALQGFNDAADIWSAALTDNIEINFDLYWEALAPGVVGSASSNFYSDSYSNVRSALISDASSTDDTTSSGTLPAGSVDVYINRTSNNPNGANSATPFVDSDTTDVDFDGTSNNEVVRMTRSNAKALGLIGATDAGVDADINFSSAFSFDFDRSDGIDAGKMDFVGVAVHEIGHALGFTSGIDVLDANGSGFHSDQFVFISTLDLFRYSEDSVAAGGTGTIDWTADTREKVFSLDAGTNKVDGVTFSTGSNYGDGEQNSHWKDNQGIGVLDPTISLGEQIDITDNDLRAFDVIGWDLASALGAASTSALGAGGGGAAPEPVAMIPLGAVILSLRLTGRSRRRLDT